MEAGDRQKHLPTPSFSMFPSWSTPLTGAVPFPSHPIVSPFFSLAASHGSTGASLNAQSPALPHFLDQTRFKIRSIKRLRLIHRHPALPHPTSSPLGGQPTAQYWPPTFCLRSLRLLISPKVVLKSLCKK